MTVLFCSFKKVADCDCVNTDNGEVEAEGSCRFLMRLVLPSLLLLLFLLPFTTARPSNISAAQTSSTCKACTLLVGILHNLWGDRLIEDCLGELIGYMCEELKLEDNFACKGMGTSFEEEIQYVVGELVVEPSQLCGLLVHDCGTFIDPLTATWYLEMPGGKPPHKELPPPSRAKPTLRVLHLTDLHVDREYTPGEEAECHEPQCCRKPFDPDETKRSGDVVRMPAGHWGMVAACDVPYWLLTAALDHIAATHTDLDYVVVSGDLESHAINEYTKERHQAMIRNISDTIRARFRVPVLFAIGNHEGVPMDSFAPHFVPEKFHMDWLYGTMAEAWKGWVPADQDSIIRYNGCYMRRLYPGLRLISLNNGLGDTFDFFLYINQTDPDGTLAWLTSQLLDAEKAGEKVHIVAHIPGNNFEMLEGYAINYYNIVNRFEDTIAAQFFGHTHSEQFSVFYENPNNAKTRPTHVTWSAPSLTSYSKYQPAYRVYTVEGVFQGSNYRVIDWEEHYVDLAEANAHPERAPEWKVLYPSVLGEYGIKDTSASEWSKLIDRMNAEPTLFAKYRKNYYRRQPDEPCDATCRKRLLCEARKSHHNDELCADIMGADEEESANHETQPVFDLSRLTPDAVLDGARRYKAKLQKRRQRSPMAKAGQCPF